MDRQTMMYLAFFLAVAVILLVQYILFKRRQYRTMCRKVREQWGKIPDREYSLEEFEKISHYFKNKKGKDGVLDDITWNDMGMDDIFLLMNTAGSAVGEEYLYWALRTPQSDPEVLKARSALADYFMGHQKEREEFAISFARMGRKKRIALADYIGRLSDMPVPAIWPHIAAMLLLAASIVFFAFRPSMGVGILIGVIVLNLVTYYKYKGDVGQYFQCMSQVADLVEYGFRLSRTASDGETLEPYKKRLRECCDVLKPVRDQAWILVEGSGIGASLIQAVLDYFCMITHLDLLIFRRISRIVKDKGEVLDRLMETMGMLELGLCIGSFREYLGAYCKPVFRKTEKPSISCRNIYHPLIDDPVKNSIEEDRSVLVTGSNASGKSTFLKTIGVNAILAQTIYTAAADSFETAFFRIYSSMALKDNLQGNESYYMVEIRSLKRIMDAAKEEGATVLCFVDEVLRGTNTVERIAASSRILASLAKNNTLPFAATHDIELSYMLEGIYQNYHFEEEIRDNQIVFNYLLQNGRAVTRNAIRLLSIMGYDKEIVEDAQKAAEEFENTGVWGAVPTGKYPSSSPR